MPYSDVVAFPPSMPSKPERSVEIEWGGQCGRKFRPPFWATENNHAAPGRSGLTRTAQSRNRLLNRVGASSV